MNAGSGPPSRTPFAHYDPGTCSWKTSQLSLLGDLMESSPAWPRSGMWDLGAAYAHPPLARPTAANGSSSSPGLLPTPNAGNSNDGESLESWEARRRVNLAKGVNGNGQGTPLAIAAQALLKTPTAQLAVNGGSQDPAKRRAGGHGPTLADQVEHELLPTPRATDGTKGGPGQRGSSGDLMLPSAVMDLLPTPMVTDSKGTRNQASGRSPGSAHHSGTTLSDVFWSGGSTAPPSAAGNESSDGQRHHQLSLDATGSG